MSEIRIAEVPQYGVLIEKQYGKDQSLFHEVYEGAIENVADIILKNNIESVEESQQNSFEKNINTIIAFVGGRGTGKSSAMCSFANYLNEKSENKNAYSWIANEKAKSVIKRTNFYSLPVIDSSQLSEKETVIGRVTAAMYREYSDKYSSTATVEKKQTFIRFAKEVNEIAVMHRTGEWFVRGDKLLADTERISNMSDKVTNLIESFFAVAGQDKSTYLVVSIDDLDMGIGNTYAIMEEIRKFLFIKKVIVLITVDDKLLDSVLCSTFDSALNVNHQSSGSITRNLSYRYLEKMFPYNRQHHMPILTLDQYKKISASNFLGDADKNWEYAGVGSDYTYSADDFSYSQLYNEKNHPSVLAAVLHLIWRKTMLLLVCDKGGNHLLLPRNLRSLCNMVIFLRSMKDVAYTKAKGEGDKEELRCGYEAFCGEGHASERETIDHNLREFGQYLVNNISSYGQLNLKPGDEKLARILSDLVGNLLTIQLTKMNAKIVGDILQCLWEEGTTNLYYPLFFSNQGQDDLLDAATRYPESISLGDVLYVLGKLDTKTRCDYIRYLVEIIRVLWSIRMTQELYVNGFAQDDTKNRYITLRKNITEDFSETVGGFIVNPYRSNFVQESDGENKSSWFTYRYAKACVSEKLATIMISGAKDPKKDNFRKFVENESLINIKKTKDEDKIFIHPMVLFANLMAIDEDNTAEVVCLNELVGILKDTACFKYITIPLFSLDYMYRFYENLHEATEAKPVDSLAEFLGSFLETKYNYSKIKVPATAYEALCLGMANYIPFAFLQSTIITPLKSLHKFLYDNICSFRRSTFDVTVDKIRKECGSVVNKEIIKEAFIERIKEELKAIESFTGKATIDLFVESINKFLEKDDSFENLLESIEEPLVKLENAVFGEK